VFGVDVLLISVPVVVVRMPKKFQGGNQKAEEARQRKQLAEDGKKAQAAKLKDDACWVDDDKKVQTKLQRKEDALAKTEEKAARRAELKRLAEEEEQSFPSKSKKVDAPKKMTRNEVNLRVLAAAKAKEAERIDKDRQLSKLTTQDDLLLENPNRMIQEQQREAEAEGKEFIVASGVDDAVAAAAAAAGKPVDPYPEKRLKALYRAYEERCMTILRQENPSLKKSQLQERVWKQWQKAPENPLNQRE